MSRDFEPGSGDPVAFFREVAARHPRCFWLDGGGAREWSGRRSLIGWLDAEDESLTYDATRREVTRHAGGRSEVVGDDVFAVLGEAVAASGPRAHWFGYLGYAARPDLPARTGGGLPDAVWMRARHVRRFEHPEGVGGPVGGFETLAALAPQPTTGDGALAPQPTTGDGALAPQPTTGGGALAPRPATGDAAAAGPATSEVPADYAAAYARVQEHLHAGNSYEVNLTYRLDLAGDLDPAAAYLRLRALNPAPYAGFLQHDVRGHRAWLLSSSPERYATIGADRTLETKPIKGTTPRGATPEDDERRREELASEPRFRAENLMIVDLLRNDLSMVCEPGTVEVPVLMAVESYENVHQLVSTVRGRLRDDVTTIGALRALFPAGSMTGAPKLRTMQVIEEVEATPRGVYSGAFGWLAGDGRADLGVVIRSLVTAGDGTWRLGTGGGITVQSDVAGEYDESLWKADRLRAVFR